VEVVHIRCLILAEGIKAPGIKIKGGGPNGGLPELVNFAQARSRSGGQGSDQQQTGGM
jgi:hypothetical protein